MNSMSAIHQKGHPNGWPFFFVNQKYGICTVHKIREIRKIRMNPWFRHQRSTMVLVRPLTVTAAVLSQVCVPLGS